MKLKAIACLLVGLSVSGCALQKDYVALQGRLTTLEDELRQSRTLSQGVEEKVTSKNARLINRMEGLDEELRTLRGELEESLHHSTQLSTNNTDMSQALGELRASVEELSRKLSRLEAFTGYEPSDAPPPAGAVPLDPTAKPTAKSTYMDAKKAFDAGKMDEAKTGFASVVETFPTSDSADNAQFWIGEIYYREKWYQKAILEYQKVIENYPNGNKVPAAYLKQGLAFETLGETENAHLILGELLRKYPDTAEASIARKKLGQ
ncbi:tol-pal system protein YbgF [Desulfoluna limicola]|uniref:Tol-pal system protein YbgF n=1 Tax=Desulfoluna limicola TaxID=2810562 RepID=A0ABM7PJL1_9BACT|nr:tol-pal system protein YbgF [Desulfoluna limicola]BCS97341.1 tol-pal system protein YbgF [Desulfoluna limicola]